MSTTVCLLLYVYCYILASTPKIFTLLTDIPPIFTLLTEFLQYLLSQQNFLQYLLSQQIFQQQAELAERNSDKEKVKKMARQVKKALLALNRNYLFGPRLLESPMIHGSDEEMIRKYKSEFWADVSAIHISATGAQEVPKQSEGSKDCVKPPSDQPPSDPLILSSAERERFLQLCSGQLKELYVHLCRCESHNKVIIFVENRDFAITLTMVLKLLVPHFNPLKVVGQEGFNGMKWEGNSGQQEAIKKFVDNRCRLIVSTSVLEEGIDVKDCDFVIRFGGRPSLIQFTQSRGRARAKNTPSSFGKILLIYTREDKDSFDSIRHEEDIVDRY